jgi:hypothetical protein
LLLLEQVHDKIIIGSNIALYNNKRLHIANVFIAYADQLTGSDNRIKEKRGNKDSCAKTKKETKCSRE